MIKIPSWLSNRNNSPQETFQRLIRKASGASIRMSAPKLLGEDLRDLTTDLTHCRILTGRSLLTNANGVVRELVAGTEFVVPRGFVGSCRAYPEGLRDF